MIREKCRLSVVKMAVIPNRSATATRDRSVPDPYGIFTTHSSTRSTSFLE